MIPPPHPTDELERQRALDEYHVVDSAPESRFDRITRLARTIYDVPIALITLVDHDRQWFKSCIGLELTQTDRSVAFCAYTILSDDVLEVPDATEDPRFTGNPLVTGPPHIRYYAGAPLVTAAGAHLGTVCIIDTEPREPLTDDERQTLMDLAHTVVDLLELRRLLGLAHADAEEASEANASKMRFLSWLSHEVNTPLTAVRGFAQTLAEADLHPDQQRSFADRIDRAGRRIEELVGDIVEFARLEAGRLEVAHEPIDVGPVVRDTSEMLRDRAEERDITLEVGDGLDGLVLAGDERRVAQILTNLLTNAIKYNHEGGHIVVSGRNGGDTGHVDVRDTGPGIPPERRSSVFDAFDRAGRNGGDGAGLGLALSRMLARRMGGELTLDSSVGSGTTFTLSLPRSG